MLKQIKFTEESTNLIKENKKIQTRIPVGISHQIYEKGDKLQIIYKNTSNTAEFMIEITDVFIKKLHDIKNLDLLGLGISIPFKLENIDEWFMKEASYKDKEKYKKIWDEMYKDTPFIWDRNPLVYIYHFENDICKEYETDILSFSN